MSRKKLKQSPRSTSQLLTLEQACGAIRETMPEAAEVVQQHAQNTQKALDRIGQIISAPSNVNGMTLEQACGAIRETMPEATEVVLEHTQRVQKVLGLVDGIMKHVRAISEAIKRRLAPGRGPRSAKRQFLTLEQACGAIRETMPEAAEVVQQHAQNTQKALDRIGQIMSARDTMNGMTLAQAYGAIRETMPEAAKVIYQHVQDLGLIGQIMSAPYDMNGECTRHFNEFEKLLKNDYLEFARNDTYPAEAAAYDTLNIILSNMDQMRLAPHLSSRSICTVAGSFSSGKSSFLNSLIGKEVLPTDVTRTTSIPTFVTHLEEKELEINAFNYEGGKQPIDTSIFKRMTHEFEKNYKIELRKIVKRVVISTPNLELWKRVAFIDTPGYTNEEDYQVALKEVLDKPFLIWVVDCEKGTLPQEDVDLIRKFQYERQRSQISSYRKSKLPLFIVLNKADNKLTAQQEILSNAKNVADKNDLPYYGIGLYSSEYKEWYDHSGQSFDEFLYMIDLTRTVAMAELDKEVEDLFDEYVQFHEKESERMVNIDGLINRIELSMGEEDEGNLRNDVNGYRRDVTKRMNEHKKHAAQANSLKLKFRDCTRAFMHEIKAMQNA